MGILKWIQVLKIALSWSHTQSLLTEIFQAHWSIEGRWQKSLEINTTKESEEKIKINLGCIVEILKPRDRFPSSLQARAPRRGGAASTSGEEGFPLASVRKAVAREKHRCTAPWPGPNAKNDSLHLRIVVGQSPPGGIGEDAGAGRTAGRGKARGSSCWSTHAVGTVGRDDQGSATERAFFSPSK